VRHPVYLGAMLIYVGILIFTLSPIALLVFSGVFLLYEWLAADEERRMEEVFGDQYKRYKENTGRWIPHLRRSR
ncbi:MAG: isoprenylcysteine carboxylmethyltransferase family protein, partial [Chloroflexi bacterium]|nr:isoprenylcysteine carboxylmethyltransferase family protein [Chloroflexota bacterium]